MHTAALWILLSKRIIIINDIVKLANERDSAQKHTHKNSSRKNWFVLSFFLFLFLSLLHTVTKYVNITNRTDGVPGDGYGYFHSNGTPTLHNFNLTRLNELNPALNFFKGLCGLLFAFFGHSPAFCSNGNRNSSLK